MTIPESSSGVEASLTWKTYTVSRAHKAPLLRFITEALEMRDCVVLFASEPNHAPFYVVFETPGGERHAVLAYAFFANAKLTNERPDDEHRFQIKYGGDLKGILEVAVDPRCLVTTIFLGIDTERGVFVAADPVMNDPSPMSRSVEFKSSNVEEVLANGWSAWERDRRPPKSKTRPTATIDEDTRVQILVGGVQERLLDLIQLERIGRGLDPGERHLLADKLSIRASAAGAPPASHRLLTELSIPSEALFDLIDGASRLKMAVRGWVAEAHLVETLGGVSGVSECYRIEGEGTPDISLRWKDGAPLLIECKNVLRKRNAAGDARIDFQRTRASKEDPCSRYYQATEFSVLAACLHAVTEEWRFAFALTSELLPHAKCAGRLASTVIVTEPIFVEDAAIVFSKCSV